MIYVGTSGVTAIYYGLSGATRVYYGSTLAWESHDYAQDYLTFKITGDGVLNWKAKGSISKDISYSTDNGASWNTLSVGNSINVSSGDTVIVKGSNTAYGSSYSIYTTFSGSTCSFDLEGNIMSLIYGDNFTGQTAMTSDYTFVGLFCNCTGLTNASNLILPSTEITVDAYYMMFKNCTSLTEAPSLPATTLADYCYSQMFNGCTSLTSTPTLSASALTVNCYEQMFNGCTSLVSTPVLPATTLAVKCYSQMFNGCTSLVSTPVLPATTLAERCYYSMFEGCTSLTTSTELPTTTLAERCYANMFAGCTSLTTAPELPASALTNYCYYQMFSGCTSLTTAPELPASALTNYCYFGMFKGCSSLNSITCMAETFGINSTTSWVSGVSQTGVFFGSSASTWTTGDNGVPSGWNYVTGYTPVTAIYPTNPSDTTNAIVLPQNSSLTLKTRFKGKFMKGTGNVMIGTDTPDDNNDYRYFWMNSYGSYLDIGNSRISLFSDTSWYGSNINTGISGSPIDITFGSIFFTNNLNGYSKTGREPSTCPNSAMTANLNYLAIEAIQMWDNDVLVFDGTPAINPANNEIGISDSISGNFYKPQTQTGVAYIP